MILARLTPHEAESLLPQRSPTRKGVVNRALTLQAIVEALSFRRNGLGKPFTFAVLVLALSGRGLEELYRECRHDAETVNGSWRPQFNGLRSYIESLPGWDGRLPFADMMVATHNSYVSRALSVLMRVS